MINIAKSAECVVWGQSASCRVIKLAEKCWWTLQEDELILLKKTLARSWTLHSAVSTVVYM